MADDFFWHQNLQKKKLLLQFYQKETYPLIVISFFVHNISRMSHFFQFYHEETCNYNGTVVGFLTDIPSQYLCQLSCALLPDECSYFLYDFDVKECQLIDDGDWDCDITVGPAKPTFEECREPTTTTTTTATTTTTSTTTTT